MASDRHRKQRSQKDAASSSVSVENNGSSWRSRLLKRLEERVSLYLKYRAPKYWRKRWGYPVPQGDRFEDYVENNKPVVLPKDVLGRAGEKLVFELVLKEPNVSILACNAENYYCELDLVFLDEATKEIVFVEVKTRRYDGVDFRPETFAIDAKRKKKLALAGRTFKHERGYVEYRERFDVVVVIMTDGAPPTVRYHKAFFTYLDAVTGYRGDDFGKTRSEKYLRDDIRERLRKG